MNINSPQNKFVKDHVLYKATPIVKLFTDHGYEIRLVGGAVRDILEGKIPSDLDFATNATPEQMMALNGKDLFQVVPTGIDHGTCTFRNYGRVGEHSYEVTTLRKDVETDGRHAVVEFTDSWKEDAERRDLTINAMSMDCYTGEIFDYFGGLDDFALATSALPHVNVRFVGDAEKRIKEDALRIIRYIRFVERYNTTIQMCHPSDEYHDEDDDLEELAPNYDVIRRNVDMLDKLSVERIWSEFKKTNNPYRFHLILEVYGLEERLGLPPIQEGSHGRCENFDTYIGLIAFNETQALDFAERYKISAYEQKRLMWNYFHTNTNFSYHNIMKELIAGTPKEFIAERINEDKRELLKDMEAPVCPVNGHDLIHLGLRTGRELGGALQKLKKSWIDSSFRKTKTELLEELKQIVG